jgi:hypothetical protein
LRFAAGYLHGAGSAQDRLPESAWSAAGGEEPCWGEDAGFMAGGSSRVIARIFSTYSTEYASLTWEWAIRADGRVRYRLTELEAGGSVTRGGR